GYIITKMDANIGYTTIFSISFVLFACAVITSFFIQRRPSVGNFYLRRIMQERKRNNNWRRILNAHFFQGLREGVFAFIISIWVFIVTKSEFALGTFNLVLSGLSAVFYLAVTKTVKPAMRKKAILIGALLLYGAIFLILFEINYTLLIIYATIIGIAYPIIYVPYVSLTYDVIGKGWKAGELRVEYIVVRELFLNSGRMLSIIVFLLSISFFDPEMIIPVILVTFGLGHVIIYIFVKNIFIKSNSKGEVLVKEQITDEKNR
ncbi:MAG TPA: MFS transporter, partial [Bacillota bacterium]|nr:MFS transporter [Bacillota bacterium]